MNRIRKVAIATATFAAALGIGFVMQNQDAFAAFGTGEPAAPVATEGSAPPEESPVQQPVRIIAPEEAPAPIEVQAPAGGGDAEPSQTPVQIRPDESAPDETDGARLARPVTIFASLRAGEAPAPSADMPRPVIDQAAPLLFTMAEPAAQPPILPAVADAPRLGAPEPVLLAALGTDALELALPAVAPAPLATPSCDTALTAAPQQGALVSLTLRAPCDPESAVVIHHRGMMFSALTDGSGRLSLTVPALAERATFIAELTGGESVTATAEVADMGQFDRAVLQWEGTTGMELHALEYGAGYDDEGHVWWGAPRAAEAALEGMGGYITELGDETPSHSYFAEIYTFPSGTALPGEVQLSVEAVITPDNCGQEVSAQSLQVRPGAAPEATDLTLAIPGCDALGQYLVLSNMLEDLTLAAR
ncbi:translocase [Pseudoroseicyclus tamaricis]|uniref:Translocase n=1 Tax=Pseudoroseicyclus tamaricis TaxID=2705421 RepID=A0A6B2JXV8_9RHOB|nr:translocase [Pseudoroseicyclus tamaricis]NDV02685.1 translocase [Pseudoroseicyclus tamaricis]